MGYLLLRLPQVNRALWRAARLQARLTAVAVAGHQYASAAVDAIGVGLLSLSLVGSLYVVTGLIRRGATVVLRWSAGRPARRALRPGSPWPARPRWPPSGRPRAWGNPRPARATRLG